MNCKKYNTNARSGHCGFSGAVVSDVGCVRRNNEDNFIFEGNRNRDSVDRCQIDASYSDFSNEWHTACVFDGMGGGAMGEVASNDAAKIFLKDLNRLTSRQTRKEVDLILHKAFLQANNHIVSLRDEATVLGTTAVALCSNGAEFKVYYLGDSRAYLVRNGQLCRLTKDQTLAQMKIDAGIYRRDDAMAEADKHKLTDFIGRDRTKENIKPEESPWIPLQKDDRILLCSDGLTDMCTDEEISGILMEAGSAPLAAEALVNAAKAKGGRDNITCLTVFYF